MARDDFTGDDGYDVDKIFVGSQDHHGHTSYMRIPVPKPWIGQIGAITQSAHWPEYKSQQAFVRDAIYHRLHWAEDSNRLVTPTLTRLLKQAKLESRLAEEREEVESYEALRDNLDAVVGLMNRAGNQQGATRMLDEFEDEIESHQEPYRSKLLDQLGTLKKRVANAW